MTNLEQLNRLKEPWRSQAFENMNKYWKPKGLAKLTFLNSEADDLPKTLMLAFYCGNSKEGYWYWFDIINNPQNYLQDESKN